MLQIVKFGDRDGNGAIVEKSGWFSKSTWTANNDTEGFEKWICRETGEHVYKTLSCIDKFYKAQFDTKKKIRPRKGPFSYA